MRNPSGTLELHVTIHTPEFKARAEFSLNPEIKEFEANTEKEDYDKFWALLENKYSTNTN
jgi:hypothetical protein